MSTQSSGAALPKKARGVVVVHREVCKGCAFCVEFCPTHALELEQSYNAKGYHPPFLAHRDKCNGCNLCGLYCPDFAIFGYRVKVDAAPQEFPHEG